LPPTEEFTPFPDNLVARGEENDKAIPFQHYVSSVSNEHDTSNSPYNVYKCLLGDMRKVNSADKLSYNFVMTNEWIFLSPRKKDDYIEQGFKIDVNSTGMVGLLLTKSEEESRFLEQISPARVLENVGIAWPSQREKL
jgi:ATP adenylyltransferase/5',5'''-P-1,P-4-tetraphosphate phosphorylase II